VLVGPLKVHLEVMLILDHEQLVLSAGNEICATEERILYLDLLSALLL
jgi:hypothetical protein